MADLSDYANQLLMQYMTPEKPNFAENDPYVGFQSVLDPINQIAIGADPEKYGTGERATLALISGLLGGGLEGLSDDYQSRAKKSYFDVALGKGDQADIDMLDGDLFSSAEQANSIFKLVEAEKAKSLESARSSEIFKAMLSDPYKAKRGLEMMGQGLKGKAEPIAKLPEEAPEGTEPIATKPATVGGGELSLTDKYDQLMDQTGGNESLADKMIQKDLDKPKEDIGQLDTLRKEIQAEPAYKNFLVASRAYPAFLSALDDVTNPAADFEIAKMAVQMIEPGLSVNAGEAAAVNASASIPSSWKASIQSAIEGTSKLPAEIRTGLVALANRQYGGHEDIFNQLRTGYNSLAKKRGLLGDGENVDILGDLAQITKAKVTKPTAPIGQGSGLDGGALVSGLQLILQKVKSKTPLSAGEIELLAKARGGGGK